VQYFQEIALFVVQFGRFLGAGCGWRACFSPADLEGTVGLKSYATGVYGRRRQGRFVLNQEKSGFGKNVFRFFGYIDFFE